MDLNTNALDSVRQFSRSSDAIPKDLKALPDLSAMVLEYGNAMRRVHVPRGGRVEYFDDRDAPDFGPIQEEIERLQGNEFTLLEVVHELLAKCEASDDCQYGTLSTTYVREALTKALKEVA